MFVPAIGHYILKQQDGPDRHDASRKISFKGAGIGNGWMNAYVQGPATIDYSWWHGLIDQPTRDSLQVAWKNCMEQMKTTGRRGNHVSMDAPFHPFSVQDDCGLMWGRSRFSKRRTALVSFRSQDAHTYTQLLFPAPFASIHHCSVCFDTSLLRTGVLQAAGQPNAYDITTWDPNVDQVTFSSEVFYNDPIVKAALHAPTNITWHGCRQGEGRRRLSETTASSQRRALRQLLYMEDDEPVNVVPYLADMLDAGITVVVYNGDRDMTTNMVGTELLLNDMEWKGKDEWNDAPRGLWNVNGYPGGWAKELKGLSYVVVYNSGHMVPYNQPEPAYDLLKRLLTQQSFLDDEMPKIRVQPQYKIEKKGTADDDFSTGPTHMSRHHNNMHWMTGIIFFLIGIVSTLFVLRFTGGSLGSKGGYSAVPESDVSMHAAGRN